jgi:hypothetical protein
MKRNGNMYVMHDIINFLFTLLHFTQLHTEFQQRISSVSGVSLAKEMCTGNSTAFLAIIDPKSIGAEGRDLKTSFQNNQILYFFIVNSKFHIFNMNLKSMTIMV